MRFLNRLLLLAKVFEQSGVKALTDIIWQGDRLGITEDPDGLAWRIDDEPAGYTFGEMLFEVHLNATVERPIEIARKFEYDFLAVQCDSLRRKYLSSFWRSLS